MKANEIQDFLGHGTDGGVSIIFNDSSVKVGHGLRASIGDGTGAFNLWDLDMGGYYYMIDGNEVASLHRPAKNPDFPTRTKPSNMAYDIGDRVRLRDDGDTDYIITSTKEMPVGGKGLGIFDYGIKKDCTKKEGAYTRKVFKENIYGV